MRRIGWLVVGAVAGCAESYPPEIEAILALEGDYDAGEIVFFDTCGTVACHGPAGTGGTGGAANLRDHVPEHDDAELAGFIVDGTGDMVPVDISSQEAADVIQYLRETYVKSAGDDH